MNLAQRFVHHSPEHLGKPEIGSREHAKNCRDSHHHVEMAHHEIGRVQVDIQRRLRQEEPAQPARDEDGNEPDGKQSRRMETQPCSEDRA